jgi:anaphase-promoting complex subunit 4
LIVTQPYFFLFQLETNLLYSFLPEVTRMARKFTHISALLQVFIHSLFYVNI